jgi:hypothetical protein
MRKLSFSTSGSGPQEIEAIADFEADLARNRSRLLYDDVDNFLCSTQKRVSGAKEYGLTRGHWRRRPGLVSAVGGRDGEFRFRRPGLLNFGEQFSSRGIPALRWFVARRADPFSTHVKIVVRRPINHFEAADIQISRDRFAQRTRRGVTAGRGRVVFLSEPCRDSSGLG